MTHFFRKIAFKIALNLGILILLFGFSAAPVWAKALELGQAEDAFKTGIAAFQAGDYEDAADRFSQAIQASPEFAAAYSDRCLTSIYLENYAGAIADCDRALQLNASDTEAYLNRGLAQHRTGHYAEAIADFTQLLQLKQHDFRAYYNRGLAQAELAAYREAIVDYGEALRQVSPLDRPIKAEIHTDRGLAQLLLENDQGAIADFTEAIQFNADIRAYYNRGCAYHQQGNAVAALNDFSRVLQLDPTYAQAYLSRGLIRHERGNRQEAIADLRQAADCFCDQGLMMAYRQTLDLLYKLQGSEVAIG